jgi:hypothetical protein
LCSVIKLYIYSIYKYNIYVYRSSLEVSIITICEELSIFAIWYCTMSLFFFLQDLYVYSPLSVYLSFCLTSKCIMFVSSTFLIISKYEHLVFVSCCLAQFAHSATWTPCRDAGLQASACSRAGTEALSVNSSLKYLPCPSFENG